ncbi:hypothetical protein ABFS83_12G166400 [Erythranthe nasuta]
MDFSSIPAYLDSSNWHLQHQNHQIIGIGGSSNPLLPPPTRPAGHAQPPPPPPLPPQPHGGGAAGSIRPGSMSERARMANIPMPETALKCPRCESTNTKFCYFNNYSLSQPRHFCKTCRRYWTRGGALRSVPVGGGCRRNKRSSKSTTSKSPASSDRQTTTSSSTSTVSTNNGTTTTTTNTTTANILGLTPQFPPLRFLSPLSQLTDNFAGEMGLNNYTGISAPAVGPNEMNFHSIGGINEPWRMQQVQQFPFFGGLNLDSGINYQFHGGDLGFGGGGGEMSHHHHQQQQQQQQVRAAPKLSSSFLSQLASVKMEDNNRELSLSRQLLMAGNINNNNDQWINNNNNAANTTANNNWNDLSSFSSSSTSNPLQ